MSFQRTQSAQNRATSGRRWMQLLSALLIAGLSGGCSEPDGAPTAAPASGATPAGDFEHAKAQTKEATEAIADYAYAQKSEFVDRMAGELRDIEKELDELAAKVDQSSDEASSDAKARLQTAREKWTEAKQRLDQAERATESDWDEVMRSFDASWSALQDDVGKARRWLSDQIAP